MHAPSSRCSGAWAPARPSSKWRTGSGSTRASSARRRSTTRRTRTLRARARWRADRHVTVDAQGPALCRPTGQLDRAGGIRRGAPRDAGDLRANVGHGLWIGATARPGSWTRGVRAGAAGGRGVVPAGRYAGCGARAPCQPARLRDRVHGGGEAERPGGKLRLLDTGAQSGGRTSIVGVQPDCVGLRMGWELPVAEGRPGGSHGRTYTLQDMLAALKRGGRSGYGRGRRAPRWASRPRWPCRRSTRRRASCRSRPRRLPADSPAQAGTSFEDRMRTMKQDPRPAGARARDPRDRLLPELRDDMDEAVRGCGGPSRCGSRARSPGGPPRSCSSSRCAARTARRSRRPRTCCPSLRRDDPRGAHLAGADAARDARRAGDRDGKMMSEHEGKILAFKLEHLRAARDGRDERPRDGARPGLMDMHLGAIADARRRRATSSPRSRRARARRAWRGRPRRGDAPAPGARGGVRRGPPGRERARREWQEAHARRDEELARFRKRAGPAAARPHRRRRARAPRGARRPRKERQGLQRRVDAAPRWAQELANLSRDYEVLRGRYARRCRAAPTPPRPRRCSRPTASMFRMVEPPAIPAQPVAPIARGSSGSRCSPRWASGSPRPA